MAVADPTTIDGLVGDPAAASAATGWSGFSGDTLNGISSLQAAQLSGAGDYVGGTNVAQTSANIVADPTSYLQNNGMNLSDQVQLIDANTAGTSIDPTIASMDVDALNINAAQSGVAQAAGATQPTSAQTGTAVSTYGQVSNAANTMNAATTATNQQAIIDAATVDMQGLATGTNKDGSTNETGKALNTFASQDISNVIDTSTVSGKLLAQSLGEGNYIDAKATVMGQLEKISADFVDPVTGQTKIPTWAAGQARAVSRIISFKGVSGTAAIAATAQAMMEATLPIAQQEAEFYQSITIKNLDNKQQKIINTANILSKMEQVNLDNRMTAAVNNSKTFMAYDLANLENEQQANLINTQARVQSILEDAKQENVMRQFNSSEQNTMDKFYANLDNQISMFNAEQKNVMEKFNTGELNDTYQFNATLQNNREQWYKEMSYDIEQFNAQWRQDVTLQNNENAFNAAATDVKNAVDLTSEQLSQMWDRADAALDYAWKEGENAKDRENKIALAKIELEKAQIAANANKGGGIWGAVGQIGGAMLGAYTGNLTGTGGKLASWAME